MFSNIKDHPSPLCTAGGRGRAADPCPGAACVWALTGPSLSLLDSVAAGGAELSTAVCAIGSG